MRLAPVLYLVCGYWMITNQQLLSNHHLHPMMSEADKPKTDHDLSLVFSPKGWVSPYWPLGGMTILFAFFYLSADHIYKNMCSRSRHYRIGDSLQDLEEGLDNYWAALRNADKRWSQKEEYYRR